MPFEPHDIRAVIFDMDGVLLDTEVLYKKAAFLAAEALGFVMTDELHLKTVGIPGDAADLLLRDAMGPDFPFDSFDRHWKDWMAAELGRKVPVKQGAVELLGWLNAQGIPAAVATSTRRKPALDHLGKAGLARHFQAIVTRDDVTNGKPHPEPFLTAAARLGVDPAACLAIEDSHNGVRAAHAAGMRTIMVPDLLPPVAEIEALCAGVLESLSHVHAVFDGRSRSAAE